MAKKLLKPKRGKVENLSKLAVEDGALVFTYDTKATTSTVLVDIGNTRYDLAAGAAKKANNADALGGSSLQNIVDKIDNATGNGTAFTGLDTTTNNKVKLTRANGTTVEKTINNVSNASTADYAKVSNKIGTGTVGSSTKPVYINAGTPTAVSSIPSTFVAAQQINGINLDTLRTPGMYWAGGGNTNTNKPTDIDAFGLEVLQSAAGWYTQICYASNNQEKQFIRYYNSTSWTDWVEQNRLNTKTQSGYAPAPNAANKVYRTDASGNPGWGTLNDSSIGKLASTVTLGDGNGAMIDQNGETYRQRINIFDNTIANDAVFSFQQSTDAGKTYKDLFAINDNGIVVASTFQGALKGTADYSKNSGALGGSSLQNIVDKINNSTGNGTAFTGLDTTTNNKVKLTRANGGTVEKTINNVSNASTADYAKNSDKLDGYHETDFLRYRGATGTSADSLWNQIGIKEFDNCYPDGLNGIYPYGAVISLPTPNVRFDIWVNHQSSNDVTNGLQYRSGWTTDKRPWRMLLDSVNFTQYAANKNAYNSASVSNATITLGRSDGSTGTTLTVNNVAHSSTADLAKNSNALGGSSLKNITDRIDSSVAANDAMHYMGTLGATAQKPTITALPTTARIGDAYKVITAGTYASIAAEVGDLFIYSGSWTLIPSGDDGNVYVGDSKSSKFAAKSNNIVVAVGDQKVASAVNVTANAGTISALQSTMTQLKANQGTVTMLDGNKATFSTLVGRLKGDSDATYFVRSTDTRAINTLPSTYMTYGMGSKEEFKESAAIGLAGADYYSHVITHIPWTDSSGGRPFQVAYSGTKIFTRGSASNSAWGEWYKVITGADALTSSASAISSTNNYFTAGATTALIAAKTASAVGNYLPLSGGTMTGTLTLASGSQKGIKIGSAYISNHSTTNGEVVLQGGHLRFGSSDWDYNQWAGLKYDAGKKSIYLGLADNAIFTANSAQSGGSIFTPGVNNIYVGASTATKVLTSANIGDYASGKTAFTELDTTTNNVIKLTRANGATIQKTINNVAKASTADRLTMEAGTADAARNVWFSDSNARNKVVYNDNFKYNPAKNSLTTNITGEAASANYAKGGESESNYQLNSTNLHATIDLTSSTYNQNTWYPVVGSGLPSRGYSRIICYVQLNSGTKPSWSTHGSGFTCNLDVLAKASGWGTTNAGTIVLDYSWGFTQGNVSPISYQQLTNSSCPVIWMRGGGKYFIRSSEKFTWTVKTSSYTVSSQTIAPQTSCPELSLTRSTIYANVNGSVASAGSATNASTAEYAKNAGKLGGIEASKYAKKEDIPAIPSNLDVANRLQSYAGAGNTANSLFYRYGVLGSSWSNFPVSSLPSTGIGANFQGKNTGVLHIAAGSSYHDLAFTAGARDNQGILYAGTGRNPAYILDTENYKTKGNVFNSLTANTSFTAKVNVTIDGGSY